MGVGDGPLACAALMRYVQRVHRTADVSRQVGASLVASLVRAALAAAVFATTACKPGAPPIELYADGIDPQRVRFEVEDLGAPGHDALNALAARGDVDGKLLLPDTACDGPCRAALVSVFITNDAPAGSAVSGSAVSGRAPTPLAPPVIRLDAPAGKPARGAFAFRGAEISPGRIGRIRWIVELWPDEKALTATLSSSVFLVDDPTKKQGAPAQTTTKEQP